MPTASPRRMPSCGCTPMGALWLGDDQLYCPAARRLRAAGLRAIKAGDDAVFNQAQQFLAQHVGAAHRAHTLRIDATG
jgi:hypothetical protein